MEHPDIAADLFAQVGGQLVQFVASPSAAARAVLQACERRWGRLPDPAGRAPDVRVALGGDGCVLRCLQMSVADGALCFGANCGTVGFLANPCLEDHPGSGSYEQCADGFAQRLAAAERFELAVLEVTAFDADGTRTVRYAVNDVALWRASPQASKLRICVNGTARMDELVGDGLLVATPAGSTGYNLSAKGPILPFGSSLLAMTPLNPYRPRRWPGAMLEDDAVIDLEVLYAAQRPVHLTADQQTLPAPERVRIARSKDCRARLAFDPEHRLDERVIAEQFAP